MIKELIIISLFLQIAFAQVISAQKLNLVCHFSKDKPFTTGYKYGSYNGFIREFSFFYAPNNPIKVSVDKKLIRELKDNKDFGSQKVYLNLLKGPKYVYSTAEKKRAITVELKTERLQNDNGLIIQLDSIKLAEIDQKFDEKINYPDSIAKASLDDLNAKQKSHKLQGRKRSDRLAPKFFTYAYTYISKVVITSEQGLIYFTFDSKGSKKYTCECDLFSDIQDADFYAIHPKDIHGGKVKKKEWKNRGLKKQEWEKLQEDSTNPNN